MDDFPATIKIGLDMDGVIYDWYTQVQRMVMSQFGVTHDEWEHPKGTFGMPTMTEEHWDWYHRNTYEVFYRGEAYPMALWAFKELEALGEVHIITHTPTKLAAQAKWKWLEDHYFRLPEDRFHPLMMSPRVPKSSVKCDLYIDDGDHVLHEIYQDLPESKLILVDRVWNGAEPPPEGTVKGFGLHDVVNKAKDLLMPGE